MTGRPRRRRRDPSSPLVDLAVVFEDDELVDSIAASAWESPPLRTAPLRTSPLRSAPLRTAPLRTAPPRTNGLPERSAARARPAGDAGSPEDRWAPTRSAGRPLAVDPLTELFGLWRQELAIVPIPAPPVIRRLVPTPASRRRALRPALSIAAAIAMLLAGSATVGAKSADPNDVLWPITEMVWPDRAQSVQSVLQVREALAEARSAIAEGRSDDAQLALLRAAVELGHVDDVDGREDMELAVNGLWAESAPANQRPFPAVRQVDTSSSSPVPTPSKSATVGQVAGATAPTPMPLVAAIAGPVSTVGGAALDVPRRPISPLSAASDPVSVAAAPAATGVPHGPGVSSGSGTTPGPAALAGSTGSVDVPGTSPAVAPVAIPTLPVVVETPTVPAAPPASATEQSPPTPPKTPDPTGTGGSTGGKDDGTEPLTSDGPHAGSGQNSAGSPAVSSSTASGAESGAG